MDLFLSLLVGYRPSERVTKLTNISNHSKEIKSKLSSGWLCPWTTSSPFHSSSFCRTTCSRLWGGVTLPIWRHHVEERKERKKISFLRGVFFFGNLIPNTLRRKRNWKRQFFVDSNDPWFFFWDLRQRSNLFSPLATGRFTLFFAFAFLLNPPNTENLIV